jgi:hypothetical protein
MLENHVVALPGMAALNAIKTDPANMGFINVSLLIAPLIEIYLFNITLVSCVR